MAIAAAEATLGMRQQGTELPAFDFALLLAAALSVSMAYGVTLPLVPVLLESLGQYDATGIARHTGWLTAVYTAALFIFSPVWGALSDRVGRRAVIIAGLVGSAVALIGTDWASTLVGLYAARIGAGILSAAVLPVVLAYVAQAMAPADRQRHFAWIASATALGFLLGPVSADTLRAMAARLGEAGGSTLAMPGSPLDLVAAISLVAAVLSLRLPRSLPAAQIVVHPAPAGGEARIRNALLLTAFVVFGITIAEVGLTLMARDMAFAVAWQVSVYFALCSGVMVAVQLWAYPGLEHRFGEPRLVRGAFAGMAIGVGLLTWPVARWMPVAAFVMLASGAGILIPALAVRASTAAGALQGWALGRQAAAANLGQAAGAAATGALYAIAAPMPFVIAALVLGAGSALASYRSVLATGTLGAE